MDLTKREKIGIAVFGSVLLLVVSILYLKSGTSASVEVLAKEPAAQAQTLAQEGLSEKAGDIEAAGQPTTSELNLKQKQKQIKVCILGEISRPGVYTLNEGDRIEQVINLAGGFTEKAHTVNINLAQKVRDEDLIRIPNVNDARKDAIQAQTNAARAGIVASVVSQSASNGVGAPSINTKININTANKEQLKELPRIGDAIAQRILDFREQAGSFKSIEGIMDVSGIGQKMFENLKDKITVSVEAE